MDRRTEDSINTLAFIYGVDTSASLDNKILLLTAMDILKEKHADEADFSTDVASCLKSTLDNEFKTFLRPANIVRQNRQQEIEVSIPVSMLDKQLDWSVQEENGTSKHDGKIYCSDLEVVKDMQGNPRRRVVDGVEYEKRILRIPAEMDIGYHALKVTTPDGNEFNSELISCPEKCYDPIDIANGGKTWGVPVQIYEQKSEENQGVGDFSDVDEIAHTLAEAGAGIVGLSPVHAMPLDKPEEASPYASWSRTYYNPLFCDVTAIPDFEKSKKAQEKYDDPEYTAKRRKVQSKANIDYTSVVELKLPIWEECYEQFWNNDIGENPTERGKDFINFCTKGIDISLKKAGHSSDLEVKNLHNYAVFSALSMEMANLSPKPQNWRDWPEEFQDPESDATKAFAKRNMKKINFFKYMQWETNRQLKNVQTNCKNNGMKIGVYTDIAVGSSPDGFEGWGQKDLFVKASAGAPPDMLSSNGQNWEILGFKPYALKNLGYQPFRVMLEANMKHAGCSRLDHVLQLARLYMIPHGKSGRDGAFLYYPVDDMMAIVALESHRNKCMLIGEDIGCLPPGFREKMEDHGILSYRVMPFERGNGMNHPESYPKYSTAAPSTHDTPPLASQWTAKHVHQKDFLGFYGNEGQKNSEFEDFARLREQINWALTEKGCWEKVGAKPVENPRQDTKSVPFKFEQAVADYLGQANSAIMLMPFSDIFRTNYMGNIPGTRQMHSSISPKVDKDLETEGASKIPFYNWRPKMHVPTHAIKSIPVFKDIANILNGYRKDGTDKEKQSQINQEYKRPGRNETYGKADPGRIYRLYEALSKKGQIKEIAYDIIAAKFSKKHQDKEFAKVQKAKEDAAKRRTEIKEGKSRNKIVEGLMSPMQFAARVVRKGNR